MVCGYVRALEYIQQSSVTVLRTDTAYASYSSLNNAKIVQFGMKHLYQVHQKYRGENKLIHGTPDTRVKNRLKRRHIYTYEYGHI